MNSTRMRRLLWRTGFMMFCPNEKKASEYEPEKRGPLKGLFHAASSAGVPWASYSIQPWLLYEPFSPMPCPSCYTDHHFSCKTGILSLESFSRGIYILSSTSSKPFPPFTRNWTPQRTFIMIFIGLFRAGYRGKDHVTEDLTACSCLLFTLTLQLLHIWTPETRPPRRRQTPRERGPLY